MQQIGEIIKKRRQEKKLTLAEVANGKMSPAMVSLVENDKTSLSADKLQHIAKQLDLNVADLLGGMPKEQLRNELAELENTLSGMIETQVLRKTLQHITTLLPGLGSNFESARIYELYVLNLFRYYLLDQRGFDQLEDSDWNRYAAVAARIYEDLQMESRVLRIQYFYAAVESHHGNYQKTLEQIDKSLSQVRSEKNYETIAIMIEFLLLKLYTLMALGETEQCLATLDDVIQLSNKYKMFHEFFEIHNKGALIHYNEGNFSKAREYKNKIETFFELIDDDDYLYLDKELIFIHYMEFFEREPQTALEMLDQYELRIASISIPNANLRQTLEDHIADAKARCYTQLGRPVEALPLFRQLVKDEHSYIEMHPIDVALREITKTYQALCYKETGEIKRALDCAGEAVKRLRRHPHTAYYHFARRVLHDLQSHKNRRE
ncbi:helix-turn-helix domain-containing protein [Lentibacillus sediminis]|uniref:helix-turn-helix domain-containing protein n=1 Tax=Lentibacillus sediminis TaxID=1940529 RepID=UPI000C1C2130|nr:helix-turn-helix transcriptional regulator [Lentibacillus sediminis]